jgi:hypothetical protein
MGSGKHCSSHELSEDGSKGQHKKKRVQDAGTKRKTGRGLSVHTRKKKRAGLQQGGRDSSGRVGSEKRRNPFHLDSVVTVT